MSYRLNGLLGSLSKIVPEMVAGVNSLRPNTGILAGLSFFDRHVDRPQVIKVAKADALSKERAGCAK